MVHDRSTTLLAKPGTHLQEVNVDKESSAFWLSLLRQKIPTWVESAELAVQVAFARGELAQSGAPRCSFRCRDEALNSPVYVGPSEATPILLGLHRIREFGRYSTLAALSG